MKTLVSVLFLMALVSCNGKDSASSKTQSCTFNDEPVDCDALHSREDSSPRPSSSKPVVLKASVTSSIEVDAGQIIFLENQEDTAEETSDGAEYSCGVETRTDNIFQFKIEGKKLVLSFQGVKLILTRESDGNGLEGKWVARTKDEMGEDITTMIFSKNKVQYSTECRFK